ncbi:hypothetical protein [Pararhizobium arenae]|uniref:hypothetical protein n=1 Tax=Pararhizobium arenae TaxID=1856850 RepID=UPI000A86F5BC|nr:hypothetical protein [Pararhizobium arenae]
MLKLMTLAAAATIALSSASYAQTAMMPMTCDTVSMENLSADVQKAQDEAQKSRAQAAVGDATVAMQAGNVEACVAAMQKARMEIDKK